MNTNTTNSTNTTQPPMKNGLYTPDGPTDWTAAKNMLPKKSQKMLSPMWETNPAIVAGVIMAAMQVEVAADVKVSLVAALFCLGFHSLAGSFSVQPTVQPIATVQQPIVPIPKSYEGEVLVLTSETKNGKEVFVLKTPGYNYRFCKGFCYHEVKAKGLSWPWDKKRNVRTIPVKDLEVLIRGLRNTYSGAKLVHGNETISL